MAPGAGQCPAAYSAIPTGTVCNSKGTECGYPQGRCACAVPSSGPAPVNAQPKWSCEQPGSNCPEPRPISGTACAAAGLSCDYGSCELPGGSTMVCNDGLWGVSVTACPD